MDTAPQKNELLNKTYHSAGIKRQKERIAQMTFFFVTPVILMVE
jgi:hypothetical protein